MKQQQWRKLDGTRIMRSIEEEVRAVLVREKEMGHELKVCIGTDSRAVTLWCKVWVRIP